MQGDSSKCMEHCGRGGWEVKPAANKGNADCWAFVNVNGPLESCPDVFLDEPSCRWHVAVSGTASCLKVAGEKAWLAQPLVRVSKVISSSSGIEDIHIFGATGPHASKVNGTWKRTSEISGGYHVYTKPFHSIQGSLCLEHLASVGRWQIKPVSSKGKNESWASVEGHCTLPACASFVWRVSEGSCFQEKVDQPSVKMSFGSDPSSQLALDCSNPLSNMIHVSGVSHPHSHFNGVFVKDLATPSYRHQNHASLRIELPPQLQQLCASTVDRIVGKCFDGSVACFDVRLSARSTDNFVHGNVFQGSFRFNNGTYEGQFTRGNRNGHGVMHWDDGSSYTGLWIDGKQSGHGVFKFADGSVFEGGFLDGQKNGLGSIIFACDGSTLSKSANYEAEVWEPLGSEAGVSVLKSAVGASSFLGQSLESLRIASVTEPSYSWKASERAIISYLKDKRHGPCTYTFFNGETFECNWVHGVCPEFVTRQREVLAHPDEESAKARAEADALRAANRPQIQHAAISDIATASPTEPALSSNKSEPVSSSTSASSVGDSIAETPPPPSSLSYPSFASAFPAASPNLFGASISSAAFSSSSAGGGLSFLGSSPLSPFGVSASGAFGSSSVFSASGFPPNAASFSSAFPAASPNLFGASIGSAAFSSSSAGGGLSFLGLSSSSFTSVISSSSPNPFAALIPTASPTGAARDQWGYLVQQSSGSSVQGTNQSTVGLGDTSVVGPSVSVLGSPNAKTLRGKKTMNKRTQGGASPSPPSSPNPTEALIASPVGPPEYPSSDHEFQVATQSAHAIQGKVREVPAIIRVGIENMIGNSPLQIQITGMSGPHASRVNGTYSSILHVTDESAGDKESTMDSPAATEDGAQVQRTKKNPCIYIAGASGSMASIVNGIYDAIDELSCSQRVYIKRGNPGLCIHFWKGNWSITETENKGKNGKAKAFLRHPGTLESAAEMKSWEVLENGKFLLQSRMRCSSGQGLFGEGRSVWGLKKVDDEMWLQYDGGKMITVCSSADRFSDKGFLFFDVDSDVITSDSFSFEMFDSPWASQQPWYSIKEELKSPSKNSDSIVKVSHIGVSVKCNPSFPFIGLYRATQMPGCSMPAYVLDGPDPIAIEYCDESAVWSIKQISTYQQLAKSHAVSNGFPVPLVWTLPDHSSTAPMPSMSDLIKLDHASKSFLDLPKSLTVVASSAGTDAALFEGTYQLLDFMIMRLNDSMRVLYSNDGLGQQLVLLISSMRIKSVDLLVDGEVLFKRFLPKSDAEELALLSSLVSDGSNFSVDLFQTPVGAAPSIPAFKVISSKQVKSLSAKTVVQPHMMPMFFNPSCVNLVKNMMRQTQFDAKSFWKQCLAQMSGQAEVADFNALQRTLVS
jgi:hypothetical protein